MHLFQSTENSQLKIYHAYNINLRSLSSIKFPQNNRSHLSSKTISHKTKQLKLQISYHCKTFKLYSNKTNSFTLVKSLIRLSVVLVSLSGTIIFMKVCIKMETNCKVFKLLKMESTSVSLRTIKSRAMESFCGTIDKFMMGNG
jgi:hypothetical protein